MKKNLSISDKNLIKDLYAIQVIKIGNFKLRVTENPPHSYVTTPFLIDVRVLISHPEILKRVAKKYISVLNNITFDRIAAIPYASLPIAASIELLANIPWIYPRKEVKKYGTKKEIEGEFQKNDKVVLVDDTVTSGTTLLSALKKIQKNNLKVKDIILLIDRGEKGTSLLQKKGFTVHSLFHIDTIFGVLLNENCITQKMYDSVTQKHTNLKKSLS